jgi:hypothetical protein
MIFGVSIVIIIDRLPCLAFSSTLPCAVSFYGSLIGGDIVECCNVCSSWTFSSCEAFFTKCGVKSAVATASVKPPAHPLVCPCLSDLVPATIPFVRFLWNSVPEFFIEMCTAGHELSENWFSDGHTLRKDVNEFPPLTFHFFLTGGRYSVQNIFT